MGVLASTVVLTDPETLLPVILEAGSTPDRKHARLITNPKAWVKDEDEADSGDEPDEDPDSEDQDASDEDEDPSDDEAADGDVDDQDDEGITPLERPVAGDNKATWLEYAQAVGAEVDDKSTKADIVAAVDTLD